jgi:rubrerythrin
MWKLKPELIARIESAQKPEDLYDVVQKAIQLEHATIPAYLAAYFTLMQGSNQPVAAILRSIVVEEMLHMAIACNLLIALGGRPVIDEPGFIPTYPGPLPMGIDDDLIVPLEKCSLDLIGNIFMRIEKPEDPIEIKAMLQLTAQEFSTIGKFYDALVERLKHMGPKAFNKGRFGEEMVDNTWFPKDQLFPIVDQDSAAAAIQIIVRQGEGTKASPLDPQDEPAHYYRFEQIVKKRRLVRDAAQPSGFAFAGAPIDLDATKVWNMQPNPPPPDQLPAGSSSRHVATQFAIAYTTMLRSLHDTFNGAPAEINKAMGLMYQLRLLAQSVLKTPMPNSPDVSTGLSFVYQTSVV